MASSQTIYQNPESQSGGDSTTTLTLENILDKIAETIITSPHTGISPAKVRQNQKTIRNGILSIGRQNSETLALFQADVKANEVDLHSTQGGETLASIINTISQFGGTLETTQITITPLENSSPSNIEGIIYPVFSIYLTSGDFSFDITNILSEISTNDDGTKTILNPLNISQFINIEQKSTNINQEQANEFLDTNIYELLPETSPRQDRINDLFYELNQLLPPEPDFDIDGDGRVDRGQDGKWIGSQQYYYDYSISAPQDNPDYQGNIIEEQEAYITRLSTNVSTENEGGKSIQDLRNRLNNYLVDIDEQAVQPQDDRPEYKNKSQGYLKFRNLNQGIIIRNQNQPYIEGLDPNNQSYLQPGGGFTITMWVRFLDKTSHGTLFNFGNPTRLERPFGFKLETYVLNSEDNNPHTDYGTWGETVNSNTAAFQDTEIFAGTNTARFVRLLVREYSDGTTNNIVDPGLRDSHIGVPGISKFSWNPADHENVQPGANQYDQGDETRLLTATHIPEDFTEWYFICATYNPDINEIFDTDEYYDTYKENSNFWMNHVDPANPSNLMVNSGYGNKCKVEIISRTDLLRARGYKV